MNALKAWAVIASLALPWVARADEQEDCLKTCEEIEKKCAEACAKRAKGNASYCKAQCATLREPCKKECKEGSAPK